MRTIHVAATNLLAAQPSADLSAGNAERLFAISMEVVTALPLGLLLRAVAEITDAVAKPSAVMSAMSTLNLSMEAATARLVTPVTLSEIPKEPESRVRNQVKSLMLVLKNELTVKPYKNWWLLPKLI